MKKPIHILNLFSGRQTWIQPWSHFGVMAEIRTVELDESLPADLHADIATLEIDDLFALFPEPRIDAVIASPPCECFSVASIGHHWTGGSRAYEPKTERAVIAMELVRHTVKLIMQSHARFWWVENPRGVLRKLDIIPETWDHCEVWYCKYGDKRAKPTDLWGRWPHSFWRSTQGRTCYNGATAKGDCHHEPAPRGSRTGTQGPLSYLERSAIPMRLASDVMESLLIEAGEGGEF